ncbi:MAG: hypothetical protein WA628_17850 [Terriglobales bacterium]
MSPGNDRDWRAICEEVLREKNRDHIDALLEELLEALEERARARDKMRSVPSASES